MFRRSKYRAKPTNGFPSKLEFEVYKKLKERESLGLISDIRRQSSVLLVNCGECGTRINWKVDFSFLENGKTVYAEAKGVETADYKRKLKIWREKRPAPLEIWKGSWQRPVLAERIEVAA